MFHDQKTNKKTCHNNNNLFRYYRLLEDDLSSALNAGSLSECKPVAAAELGESMRQLILAVYAKHISTDGAVSFVILLIKYHKKK